MERRLKAYTLYLENILMSDNADELRSAYSDILTQTAFFQHERLIHLIVTVTFAVLSLMTLIFFTTTALFAALLLFFLFMGLLIPYIRHYYILENGVQHLYELYDRINEALNNKIQ